MQFKVATLSYHQRSWLRVETGLGIVMHTYIATNSGDNQLQKQRKRSCKWREVMHWYLKPV